MAEAEDSSFGITRIVDVKIEGGIQMYKVEWMSTWESSESLNSCQHLIDQFWSRINKAKQQQHVAYELQEKMKSLQSTANKLVENMV